MKTEMLGTSEQCAIAGSSVVHGVSNVWPTKLVRHGIGNTMVES